MHSMLGSQVVRYYSCGTLALVIDVSLFRFGVLLGVIPWVAAAGSYALAASVHFYTNRLWTFQRGDSPIPSQALRYSLVIGAGCAVTMVVVAWLTGTFAWEPLYAKLAAVAIVSPMAFVGHKYVTYGRSISRLIRTLGGHYADI